MRVRIGGALREFVLKSRWATASRSHRSPEQLSAGASAVLFSQSQQSFLCKTVTLHWRCRLKLAWNRNFPCLNACVLMVFRPRSATCGRLSSIILWMRGRGRGSTSCQDVEVSPSFANGVIVNRSSRPRCPTARNGHVAMPFGPESGSGPSSLTQWPARWTTPSRSMDGGCRSVTAPNEMLV